MNKQIYQNYSSDEQAIHDLISIIAGGETITVSVTDTDFKNNPRKIDIFSPKDIENKLSKIEEFSLNSYNPMLKYFLGIAWRNYTTWNIRGDARKPFLEKAIKYLDEALTLSKQILPVRLSLDKRHDAHYLDQITIASDLGILLVGEKIVRNLDKAESVLKFIYDNTKEYEPSLCWLAELYYKRGEYEKAIKISSDLPIRVKNSLEWKDFIPPKTYIVMSYRALGLQAKKKGDIDDAIKWFEKLIKSGTYSENDRKILLRLKSMVNK